MPRPARICNRQGCPEVVTHPERYCPEHKRPAWQGSTRNQKNPPGWARIRAHILHRDNNTCQYCGNPATEVDHVVPVSKGGSHRPDNLRAACTPCNQGKNLKERTPNQVPQNFQELNQPPTDPARPGKGWG